MFKDIPVVIVAGMVKDTRAIGKENGLLFHIPDDMKRFKALTLGYPIILGRKTFESIIEILGKPLPGRTNIVVTRNADYQHPSAETTASLEAAFEIAVRETPTEIHIGGGEEIYRQALPYTDRLHLTFFHTTKLGDTFFPDFTEDFVEVGRSAIQTHQDTNYEWVDYVRKRS